MSKLSLKQRQFIQEADKTWNFKIGATRSGKTYIDYLYEIPNTTRRLRGLDGINVIMGVSHSTIERNVLEPMRGIYGDRMVGYIMGNRSTVRIFGETYHIVGHEKSNAISRIQGSSIKFAYVDEVVVMNQQVFEMLKSRLDKPYSRCVLTGNPEHPNHFIKKFIEEQQDKGDMYYQHYTIEDNPFLPPEVVARLKREYEGTVYYNRYILGHWTMAEGAVYPMFKKNHKIPREAWNNVEDGKFTHPIRQMPGFVNIGVDFGGTQSAHAFNATFITDNYEYVVAVMDKRIEEEITPHELDTYFVEFVKEVLAQGYILNEIRADNAEPVLIRGLQYELRNQGLYYKVKKALKVRINERIRTYQRLLNAERLFFVDSCENTVDAISTAVWADKLTTDNKEVRLDDGSTNIDNLDAMEYSTERLHRVLLKE